MDAVTAVSALLASIAAVAIPLATAVVQRQEPHGWIGDTVTLGSRAIVNQHLDSFECTAKTAIEFPPMQAGASFGLSAVKAQIAEAMRKRQQ